MYIYIYILPPSQSHATLPKGARTAPGPHGGGGGLADGPGPYGGAYRLHVRHIYIVIYVYIYISIWSQVSGANGPRHFAYMSPKLQILTAVFHFCVYIL